MSIFKKALMAAMFLSIPLVTSQANAGEGLFCVGGTAWYHIDNIGYQVDMRIGWDPGCALGFGPFLD